MELKEIDKIFRAQQNSADEMPREDIWYRLEEKVDKMRPVVSKGKTLTSFRYIAVASMAVLFLASAYFLNLAFNNSSSDNVLAQNTEKTNQTARKSVAKKSVQATPSSSSVTSLDNGNVNDPALNETVRGQDKNSNGGLVNQDYAGDQNKSVSSEIVEYELEEVSEIANYTEVLVEYSDVIASGGNSEIYEGAINKEDLNSSGFSTFDTPALSTSSFSESSASDQLEIENSEILAEEISAPSSISAPPPASPNGTDESIELASAPEEKLESANEPTLKKESIEPALSASDEKTQTQESKLSDDIVSGSTEKESKSPAKPKAVTKEQIREEVADIVNVEPEAEQILEDEPEIAENDMEVSSIPAVTIQAASRATEAAGKPPVPTGAIMSNARTKRYNAETDTDYTHYLLVKSDDDNWTFLDDHGTKLIIQKKRNSLYYHYETTNNERITSPKKFKKLD